MRAKYYWTISSFYSLARTPPFPRDSRRILNFIVEFRSFETVIKLSVLTQDILPQDILPDVINRLRDDPRRA